MSVPVMKLAASEERKTAAAAKKSYGEKQERMRNPAVDARLRSEWESNAGRIENIHLSSSGIAAVLEAAGAPAASAAPDTFCFSAFSDGAVFSFASSAATASARFAAYALPAAARSRAVCSTRSHWAARSFCAASPARVWIASLCA